LLDVGVLAFSDQVGRRHGCGVRTLRPHCDFEVSGSLVRVLQIAGAGERLITSATGPYI
jgi:hypothetical protein